MRYEAYVNDEVREPISKKPMKALRLLKRIRRWREEAGNMNRPVVIMDEDGRILIAEPIAEPGGQKKRHK